MRRIGWSLLILVVLGAAVVAGDVLLRAHAESVVAQGLRDRLSGLHGVDVSIEGTPFFTQLLAKQFSTVDVTATSMMAGGLELDDVHAVLTGVGTEGGTVGTLAMTATVTPGALDATSGGTLTYTVENGELVATLTSAPLAASMVPHVNGDAIDLEVTELQLAGVGVAPEDLPLGLGAVFENLSVAVELPTGMHLDEVTVGADALEVSVSGTDLVLEQ
ncbi:DUF2993 domain-containing protein [Actinotalea sp. M2MS4P-6]|uniref:LmeA family phospholipid-binding protein n=1 Tax=Actinotalea sp. M2MS4P-6 TaxID=2983762 RepID=UPI0021E50593|nr:DUF2993 domain-containing protein [Actinotalea sp. M2MS4P-6]MCV2392722.1 DUF2993 domain-containing protein [Actinotalea sp. M2MS4P-6]